MKRVLALGAAVVVFAAFSALGYVIMAGSFPGTFGSGFSSTVNAMSAPLAGLFGPGLTGGAIIVIGSMLAGYILFGRTEAEDEST